MSLFSQKSIAEDKLSLTLEIAAIQNYANYWIYIEDKQDLFRKFIMPQKPHKISKGFVVIALAGVDNNGWDEPIAKTDKNTKYAIKPTLEKYLEGKKFKVDCHEIKDNIPQCIVHISKENTINQYLLMKGISKMDKEDFIPDEIKQKLIMAEDYAKENKIGVWAPFYGVLENY